MLILVTLFVVLRARTAPVSGWSAGSGFSGHAGAVDWARPGGLPNPWPTVTPTFRRSGSSSPWCGEACELLGSCWRHRRMAWAVAVDGVVVCLGLTHRQIGYWKDGESLWRHALAVTQNNDVAQHNLGCALADKGLFDEAIRRYEEAIRMNPGRADTHSALAYALTRKQRFAEAIQEYEETLHWNPSDAGGAQ